MPFTAKCPHCNETHAVDAFSKDEVEEKIRGRVKAKNDEIDLYKAKITDLGKVDAEAITRERDEAVRELAQYREASAVSEAFGSVGIEADDTLRGAFRTIYDSAMLGKADDERAAFAEWVQGEDARTHVLLRAHYPEPGEKPAAGEKPATKPAPTTETGTKPADTRNERMTPTDIRDYFRSPAYRALSADERAAKRTELQSAVLPATVSG